MHDPSLSHSLSLLGCFCDSHKAYPVWSLRALRAVNDRIAYKDIVIVSSAVSSDARLYERDGREFLLPPVANAFNGRLSVLVDKDGEMWIADETALVSLDGSTKLRRLPSNIYFWFAWFAFHPETDVYEVP